MPKFEAPNEAQQTHPKKMSNVSVPGKRFDWTMLISWSTNLSTSQTFIQFYPSKIPTWPLTLSRIQSGILVIHFWRFVQHHEGHKLRYCKISLAGSHTSHQQTPARGRADIWPTFLFGACAILYPPCFHSGGLFTFVCLKNTRKLWLFTRTNVVHFPA